MSHLIQRFTLLHVLDSFDVEYGDTIEFVSSNGSVAFDLSSPGVVNIRTVASTSNTNWFEDNLTQTGNRIHDQAGFDTAINNIGGIFFDAGAGTLSNTFSFTPSTFTVLYSGTTLGSLIVTNEATVVSHGLGDLIAILEVTNDGITHRAELECGNGSLGIYSRARTSTNFAELTSEDFGNGEGATVRVRETGEIEFNSLSLTSPLYTWGDGAGANLPPDNATPDHILGVMNADGQTVKLTPAQVVAAGGGASPVQTVELTINEYELAEPVAASAAGQKFISIPASLNGWNLTGAVAATRVLGASTGAETIDVNIVRGRGAGVNNMLSSPITLDDTQYFNTNGVIDTANDDVATGDRIFLSVVNGFDTTDAMGLSVTLTFELP